MDDLNQNEEKRKEDPQEKKTRLKKEHPQQPRKHTFVRTVKRSFLEKICKLLVLGTFFLNSIYRTFDSAALGVSLETVCAALLFVLFVLSTENIDPEVKNKKQTTTLSDYN